MPRYLHIMPNAIVTSPTQSATLTAVSPVVGAARNMLHAWGTTLAASSHGYLARVTNIALVMEAR